MSQTRIVQLFVWLALFCIVAHSIPIRSLFLRSYDDMNQERIPTLYYGNNNEEEVKNLENLDYRAKRGLDVLKRRSEIIERNRCFFNPITCY